MGVIVEKRDNTYASIVWTGREGNESTYANPLSLLDGSFAIHPPNYMFDERYKNRKFTRYDGKVHLFKKDAGVLPIGLVDEAIEVLNLNGFNVTYGSQISKVFSNELYSEASVDKFIEDFASKNFKPYFYQIEALKQVVKSKRILFESPTGSGKSLITYLVLRYLMWLHRKDDFKFLIMVPSILLVFQLFKDFKKNYGWNGLDEYVGLYNSDLSPEYLKETLTKKVVISTYQSINILMNNNKKFIEQFGVVILDEAHKAKKESKTLVRIMNGCINANYRIGMTGTIPKNLLFEKTLEGCFGKKNILVETKELQDMGILSKCKVVKVEIPYTSESIKFMKKFEVSYDDEVEILRLNKSKQYAITRLIREGKITTDQNTLVLVNQVENGELDDIANHIRKYHPEFQVEIVHGKIKAKEKDRIIDTLPNRKGVFVIATYGSFSTGISINNIHNGILASSTRAFETVIQTMGRILRLHESKDLAILYDLVDDIWVTKRTGTIWRSHLNDQWSDREKYYLEKEFPIEIFRLTKEFDILNMLNELSRSE